MNWLAALSKSADAGPQNAVWSHTFAEGELKLVTAGRPPEKTNKQTAGTCWILLEQSVDSQVNTCGDNGLVAMELSCDYGDLGSILGVTKSLFQIQVRSRD